MSRKLFFRGQHIKYGQYVNLRREKLPGKWIFGGIFQGTGDYSIIYGADKVDFTGADIEKWPVYSDTVCQYTGYKDSMGTLIFEGDILLHHPTNKTALVEWFGSYWNLFFFDDYCDEELWRFRVSEFSVIGNKFDNPELLEY